MANSEGALREFVLAIIAGDSDAVSRQFDKLAKRAIGREVGAQEDLVEEVADQSFPLGPAAVGEAGG